MNENIIKSFDTNDLLLNMNEHVNQNNIQKSKTMLLYPSKKNTSLKLNNNNKDDLLSMNEKLLLFDKPKSLSNFRKSKKSDVSMFFNKCQKHISQQKIMNKTFTDKSSNMPIISKSNRFIDKTLMCPGDETCLNYKRVKQLENEIIRLQSSINELSQMNEYFVFILNQKDSLYKELLKEYANIKEIAVKNMINNKNRQNSDNNLEKELKTPNSALSNNKYSNNYNFIKTVTSSSKSFYHFEQSQGTSKKNSTNEQEGSRNVLIKSKSQASLKNDDSNKVLPVNLEKESKNIKADNFYDFLLFNGKKKNNNSANLNFLGMTSQKLEDLENDENLLALAEFTKNDKLFVNTLKNGNKKLYNKLFEILSKLTKNYQISLKLIQRVKIFFNATKNLSKAILSGNAISILLDNTCNILDCEKCNLFLYEKVSDQLIVFDSSITSEINGKIKINKDKGIEGRVFISKEKLKIDDVYQDPRFSPDLDKETGFRTRNVLCYPLFDEDKEVFGVIEGINKKSKNFDRDDEEFLENYSIQISCILKSIINKKENNTLISRLKKLNKYGSQLFQIKDGVNFTKFTEDFLSNLFSSAKVKLLFNSKENKLYHFLGNKLYNIDDVGIFYHVMNTKDIYGVKKIEDSRYYNTLVDIPASEGLVTFPIMLENKCIAIYQLILNSELSETSNKPKELEMIIFNAFEEFVLKWYIDNINIFNF